MIIGSFWSQFSMLTYPIFGRNDWQGHIILRLITSLVKKINKQYLITYSLINFIDVSYAVLVNNQLLRFLYSKVLENQIILNQFITRQHTPSMKCIDKSVNFTLNDMFSERSLFCTCTNTIPLIEPAGTAYTRNSS